MAARVRQNNYLRDLAHGEYNFNPVGGHGFRLELVNAAHDPAARVLADITPIAYTFASSRNLTINSSATINTNEWMVDIADLNITATGGAVGPFRSIYVYDVTADRIAWGYDLGAGSEDTIDAGDNRDFDFDNVAGAATLK